MAAAAPPSARVRWGDAEEDDGDILPPPTVTGPDGKGVKTRVEYKKNERGDTVRVTTRTKVVKVEKKLYKVIGEEEREGTGGARARRPIGCARQRSSEPS